MNIQSEINEFLDLVLELNSKLENLDELVFALDRLAVLIQNFDYTYDETDFPKSPDYEYSEIRKKVESRFPDLGYYNVALDIVEKVGFGENGTGDAIDDITDIAIELLKVQWRFNNTSTEDALWNFEFSFNAHWGQHLRELQLYLHELKH
ncbi:MAG: hypothetical protein BalsKO_03600 [Balneolaceae bacterium]